MNILFVSSEAIPFAKTGGLADVAGALPIAIERLGHRVCVVMPGYRQALASGQPVDPTGVEFSIKIGAKTVEGGLLESRLPGSEVRVYLVDQADYFNRDQLYGVDGVDYVDNCERFVFFCRAALETIRLLKLEIDLVHLNDWPTGLAAAFLKTDYAAVPGFERIASLFTIHNMAYQGQFWHWDMVLTGLDWKYFNWRQMEFYGKLNLMKTGLVFADALNTVSPRYAEEIQTAPLGCGLEGVLQHRRRVLSGIMNGVDDSIWNPATDPYLARKYGPADFAVGKRACKEALSNEWGLPFAPDSPLIGIVGRLVDQKGFDLVTSVIQEWARDRDAQWVILGSGEPKYQQLLRALAERYPRKLAARFGFSEPSAHQIEAAADIFLMPSQFEPCGLNQLYSLKYGAVPVVRATGGLADSIVDATPEALARGDANGFAFQEYSSLALGQTLWRAIEMFRERPQVWSRLVANGMSQDWSWGRSAQEYARLYERTLTAVRGAPALAGAH